MDQVMELLQRLAPDEVTAMEQRYEILSAIAFKGPIGRRALAEMTALPERTVRFQCDVLRGSQLVETAQEGMHITDDGQLVLLSLGPMMRSLTGGDRLAAQLAQLLEVDFVSIQAGDVQTDELRRREMCHTAALYIAEHLVGAKTLAVMGGTTMALLAQQMPHSHYPELTVLPARGGVGETLETQANLVAAHIAGRLDAQYRMLHLPDDVSADTLRELASHTSIAEVVEMVRHPDVLVYSIGRADALMTRRGMAPEVRRMLEAKGAVAEALGMYFDATGHSLLSASVLGPDLATLSRSSRTVAVAGGRDKGQAILAAVRAMHPSALFLDEAAAETIVTLLHEGQTI